MRTHIGLGLVVALLGVGITLAAQQAVRPVPGPGTGIVTVTGSVDIDRLPPVEALQRGDWKVAVANAPTVHVAATEFLKPGTVYAITWSDGVQETLAIDQVLPGGWARTAGSQGPRRWVNLATARSVQESR
jgi:hypothetical protein